ncbi:MAG TPA: T9SS type A sorting domain-containing protein [Flavobacteriales bacterium]|nr:T9SS type A sorting domain-containing protein [Flavobacteriales bacterium]
MPYGSLLMVFALNYCDLAGNWFSNDTLEEVGHYHISVCGVYWLHFSNGMITGPLDDGVNSIALVDFESFHQDCLTTGTANQSESLDIHFFYDPAIQALFLDSEYFILNNLRFAIYDLNGRLVRNGRFDDDANNRSHIDVGGLEHGGYVISVNSERTIYGFRFVRY